MKRRWWPHWICLKSFFLMGSLLNAAHAVTLDESLSHVPYQTKVSNSTDSFALAVEPMSLAANKASETGVSAPLMLPAKEAEPLSPKVGGESSTTLAQELPEDTPFPENNDFPPSNLPPIQDIPRIPEAPEPEPEPLPTLPSPEELLGPDIISPTDDSNAPLGEGTFTVTRFEIIGSTVFSEAELAAVTAPFTNRPLTFTELLEARSAVTQLYVDQGYITSGAFVPPQTFEEGGIAEIRVIEGRLDEIQITGTQRLHPGYVSSRIAVGAGPPLNVNQLLERLQLLQLDPLIETIAADLQAGTRPGVDLLVVEVTEADTFEANYIFDNNRSPSVGTARHQFRITENNLSGLGDRLSIGYNITEGSDGGDIDYTIPLNPYNGTLSLAASFSNSAVIEDPFDILDIDSDSELYELTLRQPVAQTPNQEFALGLTASHQRSQTFLGIDDLGPFPLSPGADEEGRTRVSALRFFQEWTKRSSQQVLAVRSQFNLGLGFLDATVNDEGPDSRFFSWQGQGQWVRSLGTDSLLLLRGSVQLSTDTLLTLEQFGLGGQSTVRGYRQNQLLTDNGVLGSLEFRFPVLREPTNDLLLQVAPFIDVGHGWNHDGNNPDDSTLLGIGTGLILTINEGLTARFDWGIPLISVDSDRNTAQENGLYFSLGISFF